jgi:DNA modification methylase
LDPFSGSGTTVRAALATGRRGIGIDIRQSQVDLGIEGVERPYERFPAPRGKKA